jgi:hypothetical protein
VTAREGRSTPAEFIPASRLSLEGRVARVLRAVVLCGLACGPCFAADEPKSPKPAKPDNAAADVALLRDAYMADAKEYRFAADAEGKEELRFEPKAVMHWASPDDWSGDLFVWSREGRPEVLGCMLAGPREGGRRAFFHELHALSTTTPPRRRLPNGKSWTLSAPPLAMSPVSNVDSPYQSAKPWLAQMREVARGFSFGTIFQGGVWELRLLPQPVHRYRNPVLAQGDKTAPEGTAPSGNAKPDWHEGAIFAYVQSTGTDAEALLLVEARETAQGVRWHYAPVRMSVNPLWLKQGNTEVWRVPAHSDPSGDKTLPYTSYFAGFKKTP